MTTEAGSGVRVNVATIQGQVTLVEWADATGRLRRAFVPNEAVVDGICQDPEAGIPYGDDWEARIGVLNVSPAVVAGELRRRGIWTIEDARRNPQLALSALQAAYGLDLARLLAEK